MRDRRKAISEKFQEFEDKIKRLLVRFFPPTFVWPEGQTAGLVDLAPPETRVQIAEAGVMAGQAFGKFLPLFDQI